MLEILNEMATEIVTRVGGTYYEMTHVKYVGSYGYNMAILTGVCVWIIAIVGVITFINSNLCDTAIYRLAMWIEKKRG